ncbi:MAG: class I SAM-dependent methyltransferase [Actinobacteria bacterium]|nr:class I SAM-dependent methyltransferase [Actinomycetota bacterium]
MFDEVSPRYDLINDVLSAGNSRLWRIAMTRALQPRKGMRVLDLAAGTGTASAAIAAHGAHVTAADFSEGMLEVGRERNAGNALIDFVFADATDLPFADDSFDAATISFGLRNVTDPRRAIAEMRRVVKPGGRIVICEFSQPTSAIRAPYSWYSRHLLPRIAGAMNRSAEEAYRYLNESIEQWPAQEQLAGWLREAGLERVAYRNLTLGIVALHRGFVPRQLDAKVEAPAAKKPAARKPAAKKPAAKTAAAKKSAAKTPAAMTPAAKKPATARKPAAKATASAAKPAAKSSAKKPASAKKTSDGAA